MTVTVIKIGLFLTLTFMLSGSLLLLITVHLYSAKAVWRLHLRWRYCNWYGGTKPQTYNFDFDVH